MARKTLGLVGVCLLVSAIASGRAHAQARYSLASPPQRTQAGARLANLRLTPLQYNRVHIVLAAQGTSWNDLKKHPLQAKILRDLGTHELVPNQVKEMSFEVPYGPDLQAGTKLVLATRFFTQGQPYIHVWGGSRNDTELTMP